MKNLISLINNKELQEVIEKCQKSAKGNGMALVQALTEEPLKIILADPAVQEKIQQLKKQEITDEVALAFMEETIELIKENQGKDFNETNFTMILYAISSTAGEQIFFKLIKYLIQTDTINEFIGASDVIYIHARAISIQDEEWIKEVKDMDFPKEFREKIKELETKVVS